MSNLVQCTRCKKTLMDEEYDAHSCKPEILDSKTILYSNHYVIKDKQDRTVIGIRAFDGTSYEFIEIPENKLNTKVPINLEVTRRRSTVKVTEPYESPRDSKNSSLNLVDVI